MQILNKYKKWNPILVINESKLWDFSLSLTDNKCDVNNSNKIEFYVENDGFKQKNIWDKTIYKNGTYNNIGFTGIDNGLIFYDSNVITNQSFINILTGSTITFPREGIMLNPVKSNTKTYDLSYEIIGDEEKYLSFRGGFLQAPFKIGEDYQVLPHEINKSIEFGFQLKPQNYALNEKSLNKLYPNNEGMFFYLGTRAENKFLNDYGYDFSEFKIRENYKHFCPDDNYYTENFIEENVILKEEKLDITNIGLDNGVKIETENYYEIKTDNKYLFFNNTKDGYNVDTWDENNEIILTAVTRENVNMYLLLNNGKTGYTVDNIDEYFENKEKESVVKKITKDVINNALGFRIKKDGSIGYRYITSDITCEKPYIILEEYSFPGVIKQDEWHTVTLKINNIGNNKMILRIYVNGYLKLVSKELPLLNLRKLDENNEKQEGVPFNISIGGGTMGLCDSITWNYNQPFKYVLPLEEHFAGTFNGDMKKFNITIN